ncbi:hypothetical protein SAMN03159288_04653 [Rhizobium sp. NFACC06-2]|nr:hypothetical protein SAMN03159288_04653 [Rhizobium sp. NFACC06-2]
MAFAKALARIDGIEAPIFARCSSPPCCSCRSSRISFIKARPASLRSVYSRGSTAIVKASPLVGLSRPMMSWPISPMRRVETSISRSASRICRRTAHCHPRGRHAIARAGRCRLRGQPSASATRPPTQWLSPWLVGSALTNVFQSPIEVSPQRAAAMNRTFRSLFCHIEASSEP